MTAQQPPNEPINIALLAPLVSPISEPFLGGAQAMVRDLAVALAQRGAHVTLYAAPGSDQATLPGVTLVTVEVDLARVRPTDFARQPTNAEEPIDPAVERAFEHAFERIAARSPHHHLLHAHAYDEPAFRLAQRLPMPVAHTLHMAAIVPTVNATLSTLAPPDAPHASGQPWLVTVSSASGASYQRVCRIDEIIYNGIAVSEIPYAPAPASDGYTLYAGRITPEKGVVDAIQIALAAGMPLRLVGGIYDREYFGERVEPLLAAHPAHLAYLGAQPRERVWSQMAGARAVLVPSLWDEPFGLVACESLACGTPVIGYESGGLSEVVEQGVTGELVARGDVEAAADALGNVGQFSRANCRRRAESRFSMEAMVSDYERLYTAMLATS